MNKSIMSQPDECQTPPTSHVPTDHQPNIKRSNERRLWHELEAGPSVTPFMNPPKYSERSDRYDVDKGVETEAKKMRLPVNKTGSKNRSRRSANRRSVSGSETDTLRSELTAVHKTYHGALRQKDEEIKSLKDHLLTISNLAAQDIESLSKECDDLQDDLNITEEELTISQKSEKEWIGRALKLKFILDEIKKIGALPEDHAEWVDPMVEDIEIPEVSIRIRDEFVPTAQTDNIDWVSSDEDEDEEEEEYEEDIIGDYLENETAGDISQEPSGRRLDMPLAEPVHCTNCGEFGHDVSDCTSVPPFATMGPAEQLRYDTMLQMNVSVDEESDLILGQHGSMMNVFVPCVCFLNDYSWPRAILEKSATTIQKAWQNHIILKKEQLDRELDEMVG